MQQRFLQNKDGFIKLIRCILPKASPDFHKGLCGRVGVIGGSLEYTGAPYFAGISALRTGADLSYVFCASEAAIPIKSYSPELIVLPILDSAQAVKNVAANSVSRLHAVVLGPGLGRNPNIASNIQLLVDEVKRNNIPLVIDADGLHFVNESPSLVMGYSRAILTPNVVEFGRLHEKILHAPVGSNDADTQIRAATSLAKTMGCTVLRKGREDIITDGENVIVCDLPGSVRRCGGQGDLLSGSLGTFASWAFADGVSLDNYSPQLIAGMAACLQTRKCNSLAYAKNGQSMLTTDMISEIGKSFTALFISESQQ